MSTFYKSEVISERRYYTNKFQEKEYLDGENDSTLIEAAMLTGKGLSTEENIVYTGFGLTSEEAEKSAKIFACIHLPEYRNLVIRETKPVKCANDLTWLEGRIKVNQT